MIICPNLSDPKTKQQFEELVEVVGEDEAYFLWSANGGHTLDKTPDGKESKLFKSLLELTDSVEEAISLKAKTYLPTFTAWFGDWVRNIRVKDNEFSKNSVSKVTDENGEPLVVYHSSKESFTIFNKEKISTGLGLMEDESYGFYFSNYNTKVEDTPILYPVFLKATRIADDKSFRIDSKFTPHNLNVDTIDEFDRNKDSEIHRNKLADGLDIYDELVVFEPNQIKSVFNEGEFSENNDNIYHQLDANWHNRILRENETTVADPNIDRKMLDFFDKLGFKTKVISLTKLDYVAKTDLMRKILEVVDGKRNLSTLPEEAAHVFVGMMAEDNPMLIKMMKDITSFDGYMEIYEKYKKKYFYFENGEKVIDEDAIKKEAIGKLIANEIIKELRQEKSENVSKLRSWLNRVIEWMKTKLKPNFLQRYDNEVTVYRDAALKLLNGDITLENLTELAKYSDPTFVRRSIYYQLNDGAELDQATLVKMLEQQVLEKRKEGYFVAGRKIPKRVTDYVNRFYYTIFGEREESDKDKITAKKGTFIHKVMEYVMKDIISKDPNQDKTIEQLQAEVKGLVFSEYAKKAAKDLIANDEDFKDYKEDDPIFRLGQYQKASGNYRNEQGNFNKLVNLALAKYRNIKENQIKIDKKTGTKGKFKIFTELMIYDEKEDVAGTIDLAVIYSNSAVGIYDWKSINFKVDANQKVIGGIPDYKERAYEIQISRYKTILMNQFGVKNFAETRVVPIQVQLDYKNPSNGVWTLEAGNFGGNTHLDEIPLDKELTDNEYLNRSLETLFAEKEALKIKLESSKGDLAIQAKYDRVKKVIKGIQLRKEFNIVLDEIKELINEYNDRELHINYANELDYSDLRSYQEFATMFVGVLGDMIPTIENDEKLRSATALVKSNLEMLIIRINSKVKELSNKKHNVDLDKAYKEESMLGRTFKSLLNFSAPVFKMMAKIVGENQNAVRVEYNKLFDKVEKATNKLKEWAESKGMSLQDAFDKIIVEVNGDMKLVSRYNGKFFDERKKAREDNDKQWFLNNTLVEKKKDPKDNKEKLFYKGEALRRYELKKADFISRMEKTYSTIDQKQEKEFKIKEWEMKYDITQYEEALYKEKNYFILMEDLEKYYSDFWLEANQSGNEALKEYYEMYTSMNDEFADMTNNSVDERFIANISQDLIDSIAENGVIAFARVKGLVQKALEVRQYDTVKGTTSKGEQIKSIPLLFVDSLTEQISDSEKAKIREEVKNIKDKNGKQKYEEGSLKFEDVVNGRIYELEKKKGNKYKSRDLSRSLMLFANTALMHKHLQETEDTIKSINFYIQSGGGRHHPTTPLGERKRDAYDNYVAATPGMPKKEIEIFDKFIDAIWYGQRIQGKDKTFKIGDKEYSATKAAKLAMQYISVKALGLNAFVAFGNIMSTYSNLMLAGQEGIVFKGAIRKSMSLFRNDREKFLTAVGLFQIYAHNEKVERANKLSSSTLSKYLTMDNAFILLKEPDKAADSMLTIAMMHRYGIVNGKLVKLADDNQPNSLINLIKFNEVKQEYYIDGLSDEDYARFRQMVFHVSYKLKGSRSEENISQTDLTIWGQMAMQFRNWMPGVISNRFEKLKYDDVLNEFNAGRFTTLIEEFHGSWKDKLLTLWQLSKEVMLIKSFSAKDPMLNREAAIYYFNKFISENPEYKGKIDLQKFLDMRQAKLRSAASEVRAYLILSMLVHFMGLVMFGGFDDDDKENKKANLLTRTAYRMSSRGLMEMAFFFSPSSTLRSFLISPVALLSPIRQFPKILKNTKDEMRDSIFGENSPNDKTGWGYYSLDYIPFANQAIDFFDTFGTWDYYNEYGGK